MGAESIRCDPLSVVNDNNARIGWNEWRNHIGDSGKKKLFSNHIKLDVARTIQERCTLLPALASSHLSPSARENCGAHEATTTAINLLSRSLGY